MASQLDVMQAALPRACHNPGHWLLEHPMWHSNQLKDLQHLPGKPSCHMHAYVVVTFSKKWAASLLQLCDQPVSHQIALN